MCLLIIYLYLFCLVFYGCDLVVYCLFIFDRLTCIRVCILCALCCMFVQLLYHCSVIFFTQLLWIDYEWRVLLSSAFCKFQHNKNQSQKRAVSYHPSSAKYTCVFASRYYVESIIMRLLSLLEERLAPAVNQVCFFAGEAKGATFACFFIHNWCRKFLLIF